MLFGNKKRAEAQVERERAKMLEELSKPICQQKGGRHLWRDFPPFLIYNWAGKDGDSKISIKEKYACCYCGQVETKILESWLYTGYERKDFDKEVEKMEAKYKDILQPVAVVEDMVQDAVMLDRRKLQMWDSIHLPKEEVPQETEEQRLARYSIELFGEPKTVTM